MNNNKHTPGPWESSNAVVQSDTRYICTAGSIHPGRTEEDLANANLIAAAPDLLAALEAIHQGFVDGSIKWAKRRQSERDPYHPANTLMNIAFAKVRGDSE